MQIESDNFIKRLIFVFLSILMGVSMSLTAQTNAEPLPDFDKLWDYSQPDGPKRTEAEFRKLLPVAEKSGNLDYHLQLLTQIARTQSLQAKFDEAHAILDQVEPKLNTNTPLAEVRFYLERGRSFNSAQKKKTALPLFEKAFALSVAGGFDFYVVDAGHMIAIAEPDVNKQIEWNLKVLSIAEQSKDSRAQAWQASLYNNLGWSYHDIKKYDEALGWFQKRLHLAEKLHKDDVRRVSLWSVARVYRSLNRVDDALKVQLELEKEFQSIGSVDAYVFEELGELYLVKGMKAEMKKYFALAYQELSKDTYLVKFEADRLKRMKDLSESN